MVIATTSGTNNFYASTGDIIQEALELVGALGEGEVPNTDQMKSARRTLNMLVKFLQAKGLNLFAVKKLTLFPIKTQQRYELSLATTDHFTETFYETTTSVAASSGASTVTLTSVTGIVDGSYIGVATSTTDVHWTTVDGAPAGNVVTLTTALPANAAAGAVVYSYVTKSTRPMKVLEAYLHTSTTDIPVDIISRADYSMLSIKSQSGFVNQVYFDPQRTTSYLSVWPTTQSEVDYLTLFVQRTLDDVCSPDDAVDYPQEWHLPLAYVLALRVGPKYGLPSDDYYRIREQARELLKEADDFDFEWPTSIFLEPDFRGR